MLAHRYASFTSGFRTPESNIEGLVQPIHERFFRVPKTSESNLYGDKYHENMVKLVIMMYEFKLKEGKSTQKGFTEYMSEYFSKVGEDSDEDGADAEDSMRSRVAFKTSLSFLMVMLKNVSELSNEKVVESTLAQFLTILKQTKGLKLMHTRHFEQNFELDSCLNDGRKYLVQLAKSEMKKVRELACKVILMLGLARENVEDFLVLISLIKELAEKGVSVDLRDELMLLEQAQSLS